MRWCSLLCAFLAAGGLLVPSALADNPLDVGGVIQDIVADPVRDHLYVTLDTSELVKVDIGTHGIAQRIPLVGVPDQVAVLPDGSKLLVGFMDTRIEVYQLPSLTFETSFTLPYHALEIVASTNRLYGLHSAWYSITDLDDGSVIHTQWLDSSIALVELARNDTLLVGSTTGVFPSSIKAWDISDDTFVRTHEDCCHGCIPGSILAFAISPNGAEIATTFLGPELGVFNFPENGLVNLEREIALGDAFNGGIHGVAYSTDGQYVFAATEDQFLVLRTSDWLPFHVYALSGEPKYIDALVLSASGSTVAVAIHESTPFITPTRIQFFPVDNVTQNRGGIQFAPIDNQELLPISVRISSIPQSWIDPTFLDRAQGIMAWAPFESGIYDLVFERYGWEDVQLEDVEITAGFWTTLADVTMIREPGSEYPDPVDPCGTPAIVTGQTTQIQVHGQYFLPTATVVSQDPEIIVDNYSWLDWSTIAATITDLSVSDPGYIWNALDVRNPTTTNPEDGSLFRILPPTIEIEFELANTTAEESSGTQILNVMRSGPTSGAVTIDYQTSEGSAVSGDDYTAVSDTLSWPDGDSDPKTITVPILQDAIPEGPETFTIELSNPTGGAVLGAIDTTEVTIEDDDSSTVRFTGASTGVSEAGGTVSLTVSRIGDTSAAGSVNWATADGTALAGQDYTSAGNTLAWAAGDGSDKTIEIDILDDVLHEDSEAFTVVLSSPGGNAFLGEPSTATVNIADNDVIEIVFSTAAFSADEGAGNATITAWRTGASNGAVTIDYASADGTATDGSDYTAVNGTLTWPDGDATPKTFDVPLIDDGNVEPNETVLLALSNPTGGATLGTLSAAELTIEDNDGTLLRFASSSYQTSETGGSVEITLERFGYDTAGAVSVDVASANGTATSGLDFQAVSETVTWADGDTADKSFTVTVYNDGLTEGFEDFQLILSDTTGNAAVGTPATATVVIADDDWGEDLINTETDQPQTRPDVAMDATGRAVVVWESYLQDGDGWGIFGQRFDAAGSPVGTEFQVNAGSSGNQRYPAVAMRPDGGFTVVWMGSDADGDGIIGRRFNTNGAPLNGDVVINPTTGGDQSEPDVAVDGTGAGLVVWQSDHTGNLEIRGRRLDAAGIPTGTELVLNTTTSDDQQLPAVAGSATGGFVAAWQSFGQDGPAEGIIARRFATNGSPLGAEFVANNYTSGDQLDPAVGVTGGGSFILVWSDPNHRDGSYSSIQARWFDATATPMGGDIQVNTYSADNQTAATVACAGDTLPVVLWESENQDGSSLGVFGQPVKDNGDLFGPELQFNTYTSSAQAHPALAISDSGTFWAVWASSGQDGFGDGVYGLYGEAWVAPEIFSDGFESGDTTLWSLSTP